jgi:multicomponent Na+:H+ antiporter subunit D
VIEQLSSLPLSILLVVLPLITAPLTVLFNNAKLAWMITFTVCWLCVIMSLQMLFDVSGGQVQHYELGGWAPPWGIEYRIDGLNALVAVIVCVMGAVTSLYARKSIDKEIETQQIPMFYAAFQLCFLGLLGITLTGDIFNVFVFLEVSSLASYALIALGKNRKALTASFQYLMLGTLGATFFLIGVGLAYAATGTLNMVDMSIKLAETPNTQLAHTAFALIVVGVALKAAVYPLHLWLPNAYSYAPSVISIFLSATATKVAIYVLIRCFFTVFSYEYFVATWLPQILLALGAVAIIYGSLRAIAQTGMKKMLAYSSVAQIGYMIMGIGFASKLGLTATMLHLFNHALMKGALFMAAGLFIYRINTATFDNLKGMGREMPWTFFAMVIAALSLIGVPGTVGFVSKWQLLQAALQEQQWTMVVIILVGSLLAVVYVWKLIEVLYFQAPNKLRVKSVESGTDQVASTPIGMALAIWLLALGCIYFGINTELTIDAATNAVDFLFSAEVLI